MNVINSKIAKQYTGKIALVRVDLNINPETEEGLFRLKSSLQTIELLNKFNIRVVLISHKGRPKGIQKKESLKEFAFLYEDALGVPVEFVSKNNFDEVGEVIKKSDASVFLLENIRFYKEEETNNLVFAKKIAECGDIYINEAFSVSHRAHATIAALPKYMPSFAGIHFAKEVSSLTLKKKPAHPFIFILGGAKVSDKLPMVKYFEKNISAVLLGGGVANTVLAAEGVPMGKSLYEKEMVESMKPYAFSSIIESPIDIREENGKILDIGPKTIRLYSAIIKEAGTIIWNGPMGKYEAKGFEKGTKAIWKALIEKAHIDPSVKIIIGGGETVSSLGLLPRSLRILPENVFISTGGGAMLEFLSGKTLPGIDALK